MFKKIISNAPFSPALIGQLGFYAKRLKKEEATRRLGLIFTALALVVQSFAVFQPPESANASSSSDFVRGGVSSLSEYLRHYDANTNNIRSLFDSMGITRDEIRSAKKTTINSKNGYYSWGMSPHFSAAQGEGSYIFPVGNDQNKTAYYRPLHLWDSTPYTKRNGSTYTIFSVNSNKAGWFGIMLNCGNLVTKTPPPTPKCPKGTIGQYPKCKKSKTSQEVPLTVTEVKKPFSACSYLRINELNNFYRYDSAATTQYGATIDSYIYTTKRNGQIIDSKIVKTTSNSSYYTIGSLSPGSYYVTVVVSTSLGQKTSNDCQKEFTVPKPEACRYNESLSPNDPNCQPCPGDKNIWIKDTKCKANLIKSKTSINNTQNNVDGTSVIAKAGDRISYTVSIENTGLIESNAVINENLKDVLEYAKVIDNGGGILNNETKTLSWPNIKVAAKSKQSRIFVVQILQDIPSTTQGKSDKTSYDCVITNTFGNSISISINCPAPKIVEQVAQELPTTGPTENMIFAGITAAIVVFFYTRSRQLKTEVRLIRKGFNTGAV